MFPAPPERQAGTSVQQADLPGTSGLRSLTWKEEQRLQLFEAEFLKALGSKQFKMDKGARSSHFAQFLLIATYMIDMLMRQRPSTWTDFCKLMQISSSRFCKRRDLDRQANLCAGKGPTKANLEKISSRLANGRDVLARRPHFQSNKSKHPPPYSTLAKTYSQ